MTAAASRGFVQFVLVVGLAAVVTACTSTAAPPATPAASGSQPTDSAAPAASASGSPSVSAPPLGTCESRVRFCLPEQFQVLPLVKETLDPTRFLGASTGGQGLRAFIESQGRTVGDLEIARAREVTGTVPVTFFAFRVRGIAGSALGEAFATAAINAGENVEVAEVVGRTIARYTGAAGIEYLYPTSEVLYGIQALTEEIATDALGVLP